jgi:hypothetical protein
MALRRFQILVLRRAVSLFINQPSSKIGPDRAGYRFPSKAWSKQTPKPGERLWRGEGEAPSASHQVPDPPPPSNPSCAIREAPQGIARHDGGPLLERNSAQIARTLPTRLPPGCGSRESTQRPSFRPEIANNWNKKMATMTPPGPRRPPPRVPSDPSRDSRDLRSHPVANWKNRESPLLVSSPFRAHPPLSHKEGQAGRSHKEGQAGRSHKEGQAGRLGVGLEP